jgi:hypothetical protein
MYAEWPAEDPCPLIARHLDPVKYKTGLLEASNVDALNKEMRQGGATPTVPVIVYTAWVWTRPQLAFSTPEVLQAQNQAKLLTNNAYIKTIPGAENRVLDDASHVMIHTRRPDAVMQGCARSAREGSFTVRHEWPHLSQAFR